LLEERSRILLVEEIPITYVWQVPVIMNDSMGFMIDINEHLLFIMLQKFNKEVVLKDLTKYIYRKIEQQLEIGNSDITIH
jgi:hypothetical protein